ncbi:MAG: glycine cleavage system protein H [Anaeromyxobacteraceae bacterium]
MAFDLLSIYPAKLMEYGLGVGYMLLFIPFWKYVQGGKPAEETARVPAHAPAMARERAVRAPAAAAPAFGWFNIPAGVKLHPGHTWARVEDDGVVTVGMDDFAQKLVGPARVSLPAIGARVAQGEPAFELAAANGSVPMLSPIEGTVVAVNEAARSNPETLSEPYGKGWLFKVKAPRLARDLRQLISDNAATRFLEGAAEALAMRMSPELGRVLQDGGAPILGIGPELEGEKWTELARKFFLT